MRKDEKAKTAAKRREFLKLAGLGAASGAAVVAVGTRAAEAVAPPEEPRGYRETPHVRKVYELARF